MVKDRRRKALDFLEQYELDAMLFTDMVNIRYLTGFSGSDGALVVSADGQTFLCDSRYTTQAAQQVECEVVEYKKKSAEIVELLKQNNLKKVGFESTIITFSEYQELSRLAGTGLDWVAVQETSTLRLLKDADEIALIEQAANLSAEAFEEVVPLLVPGAREADISLALELAIRNRGGEDKSFDFIVASGWRGSMPHGVASDKRLERSELVTVDYGGRFQGYHSDETVTCALGQPTDKMRKVFDVVLEAHDRAIEAIRPGVPLQEIDAVARDVITAKGYGDYFGHGLGHGVGLEVHEAPRISPLSKGLTEAGMVFTVEPGIYLPDAGGVRIEDIVVVTADGCRILTRLPKEFRRLN